MRSITGDCESCQKEISPLTTHVNEGDFALGQGGDLHLPTAHANHCPDPVQHHPHLHLLLMQKYFIIMPKVKKFLPAVTDIWVWMDGYTHRRIETREQLLHSPLVIGPVNKYIILWSSD